MGDFLLPNSSVIPPTPSAATNETGKDENYENIANIPLAMSVYFIFLLIGIVGNALVCSVVYKVHSMRTTANYLTVNLAIADLLMVLSTPLSVFDTVFKGLDFGLAGCKLKIYSLDVLYGASTFTLICIAVERYCAVCRPTHFRNFKHYLKHMIALIWFSSCALYSPMLWACTIITETKEGRSQPRCVCSSTWPKWYHYTIYAMCIVTFLYVLPMVTMLICYVPVIRKLWRPNMKSTLSDAGRAQLKMIVKTMIAVVLVFFLLWTPYNVLYVLKKFQFDFRSTYGVVWYGSLVLAFLSNCVNPILYTLINKNFREALKKVLKLPGRKLQCCGNDKRRQDQPGKETGQSAQVSSQGSINTKSSIDDYGNNTTRL